MRYSVRTGREGEREREREREGCGMVLVLPALLGGGGCTGYDVVLLYYSTTSILLQCTFHETL